MPKTSLQLLGAAAITLAAVCSTPAGAQTCPRPAAGESRPWLKQDYSAECRARFVLESFKSLDDKIDAVIEQGGGGRAPKWLADRGLPALSGSDGPAGVRAAGPAVTSFPTPLSMAASFDPLAARLYGETVGSEFFAYGLNQMLGPALDLARTWHFGRVTESLGEDPFLDASMAGPEIQGIQSNHVVATAKHFAVYTQEQGRTGELPMRDHNAVDNIVSERTIREIYLPGFKAAVEVGKAGAIMCSFPRINGTYACENPLTLGILKREWGFDGFVTPDFPDAQRSIIAAINAGLDVGTFKARKPGEVAPGPFGRAIDDSFNGEDLHAAVEDGKVSPARIDDVLMRRLVPWFRTGAFDNPARRIAPDVSTAEHRAVAADLITRGAVLLKNDGGVLPFGADVHSLALIGTQAGPHAVVAEVGSGHVSATHLVPVLPAVRQRAGSTMQVAYEPGTLGLDRLPLIPTGMVTAADGAAGFKAEYFASAKMDFAGQPFFTRQEAAVGTTAVPIIPGLPANHAWSVRWSGRFTPIQDGVQHFTLDGGGTARLFIDGKAMGEFDNNDMGNSLFANVRMQANRPVDIRVEWTPRVIMPDASVDDYGTNLGPAMRLGWSGPNDRIARAVEAARKADVAVVFVGHKVGEGMDRPSLALPNDQDALIEAVAAANPRTVVVLETGGAVTMPWIDKVAGVLEMWLPGDSFGTAAAQLLFGDAEPGGRLPVTFPRDEGQGPATRPEEYPGTVDDTGAIDTAHFDEEMEIGYRYFDAHGQSPLFPFGFGLGYTTFDLRVGKVLRTPDGGAIVNATVRNTGRRAGSEVVQVYVGFPAAAGEPPRQLKGFQKVRLTPGESRAVAIRLPPDAFYYWNAATRRWQGAPGAYQVMVGRSSRDIVATTALSFAHR